MSAYSWGLEISRRSDAILGADAMTQRCDEITTGSLNIAHGFTYHVYRNATDIAGNWQKTIRQHLISVLEVISMN